MKFLNERVLQKMLSDYANTYKQVGLGSKIKELEERIVKLEQKKPRGRPRATNEEI